MTSPRSAFGASPSRGRYLRPGRAGSAVALALSTLLFAAPALAQLSSPLAPGASQPPAPGTSILPGSIDGVAGKGAGVHGANSPFAPLVPRDDVLPWSVLTDVKTKREKNRILPVFNTGQLGMNGKTQRIQGFMMPLEPGKKQRHFLLSSVPLTCSFCLPGGPESMVEVKTKTPVEYSMEAVVVEGRLQVLHDDSYGLYYRINDAVTVK
ncbi:MAG: DUF3299 domain-containing protein [Polaromonas sp.]|uniref:DUF3299 domain-containing protein n=1 Tax=Polaromonas sp. TaxID=1869339 RepID=UPI002735C2D5|nr:DUF3299 domain-containing protein [Polaromonas sp.]MDP3247387.1 DUF3299 domain-containing protein [Polaromonas sp.]